MGMALRQVTVCEDETFHPGICLVALEPVSNFILLEQYAEDRSAATWTQALDAAMAGADPCARTLYHPYDLQSGQAQPVECVAQRFEAVWKRLQRLAEAADLPGRARARLASDCT